MTKITREEAITFWEAQLDREGEGYEGKAYWHYGRCELQELMDKIYGAKVVEEKKVD